MKGSQKKRLLLYFLGLFIMTAGVAISVKSNLGVSPVSSIPYTLTCVWGIEMGKATILFHGVLVLLQICILRRRFQVKNLLQIPWGLSLAILPPSAISWRLLPPRPRTWWCGWGCCW